MPVEGSPRGLGLVVFSGDFARVHYALVLAAGAAAAGRPVSLFFTMEACRAFLRPADGAPPPWEELPGGGQDADFAKRGVATFGELLEACAELGCRFMVCDMGLRALGLTRTDLRDGLDLREGGVVTFLAEVGDGATMFL